MAKTGKEEVAPILVKSINVFQKWTICRFLKLAIFVRFSVSWVNKWGNFHWKNHACTLNSPSFQHKFSNQNHCTSLFSVFSIKFTTKNLKKEEACSCRTIRGTILANENFGKLLLCHESAKELLSHSFFWQWSFKKNCF